MVQVCMLFSRQPYISHHLSKAFESFFGSVMIAGVFQSLQNSYLRQRQASHHIILSTFSRWRSVSNNHHDVAFPYLQDEIHPWRRRTYTWGWEYTSDDACCIVFKNRRARSHRVCWDCQSMTSGLSGWHTIHNLC